MVTHPTETCTTMTTTEAPERAALYALRAKHRTGHLSDGARRILDLVNPGWDETYEDRWNANRDSTVKWRQEHNDADPRVNGLDVEPEEDRLGKWLSKQRSSLNPGSDRYQKLDAALPGWNDTFARRWRAAHSEVLQWRATHNGEDPSRGGKTADERRLGHWLGKQRKVLTSEQERYKLLDATLPGWRETRDHLWGSIRDEVSLWRKEHGGSDPRASGLDLTDGEQRLGRWLVNQRSVLTPSDKRYQMLDAMLPGWRAAKRGRRTE